MRNRLSILFVNEMYLSEKGSAYYSLSAQTDYAGFNP